MADDPRAARTAPDGGGATGGGGSGGGAGARDRLARAQAGLLAALVADAPAPAGFAPERLAVQAEALLAKRRGVIAKVAPELPEILGPRAFRSAFAAYARGRPMTGGYRQDALDFAAWVLEADRLRGAGRPSGGARAARRARRRLRRWWRERSGPRPPRARPAYRLARTRPVRHLARALRPLRALRLPGPR